MKNRFLSLLIFLAVLTGFVSCGRSAKPSESKAPDEIMDVKKAGSFPFYVYKDGNSKLNHFHPSGLMGDIDDLSFNNSWLKNPMSGKTCVRVRYSARQSRGYGWSGLYWLEPVNNWNVGKIRGGYDLTGAKKLRFYARGEKGGEVVEFKMGGMTSEVRTTDTVELSKNWNLYEISLAEMDLSIVNGGFCLIFTTAENSNACVIYLDEIYYTDQDAGTPAAPRKPDPAAVTPAETRPEARKYSYSEIQKMPVEEILSNARAAVTARDYEYARLLVREGLLKEPENPALLRIFTQLSRIPR